MPLLVHLSLRPLEVLRKVKYIPAFDMDGRWIFVSPARVRARFPGGLGCFPSAPSLDLMSLYPQYRPDITLAVDGDGVIRNAVPPRRSPANLDHWRGLPWKDTFPPTWPGRSHERRGAQRGGVVMLHDQSATAERPRTSARVHDRQARKEGRLRCDRQEPPGDFRASIAPSARPAGTRTGLLEASRDRDPIPGASGRFVGGGRPCPRDKFARRRSQCGGDEVAWSGSWRRILS